LFTLTSGSNLSRIRFTYAFDMWVILAFLSAFIVQFILPGMHERYMYLGDVLGVLYYLIVRKNIHLPLEILLVSLYSNIRCSRFNDVLPMEPAFIIYLLVIIFATEDFIKDLKSSTNEIAK